MKMILRSTVAAAALAGAALMLPTIATAGVDVSIGIGVPGLVYSPGPGYSPYEGQIYYDPIYYDGAWYHGPYRWRMENGRRVFWVNGGWHRNEWRGRPIPGSLTFRNGGYYRGGRYDGFAGADRINARFTGDRGAMHPDRADMRPDRSDMRPQGGAMQQDRPDRRGADKPAGQGDTARPDGPRN